MEFSDLGVVFDEGRQCSMKGMGVVSGLVKITEDDLERIMNDFDPIEAPPGPYIVQPQKRGKKYHLFKLLINIYIKRKNNLVDWSPRNGKIHICPTSCQESWLCLL